MLVTVTTYTPDEPDGSTYQFEHVVSEQPKPWTPEREKPRPRVVTETIVQADGEARTTDYQEYP